MELQMTGNMVDAQEALQLGLVNHITAADNLLQKTKDMLQLVHTKAPVAVGKIIECINTAVVNNDDISGYKKEVAAFGECFITDDMKEGTAAFLEKRKPVFTGK
jgi:enoyl-CoA hydratase